MAVPIKQFQTGDWVEMRKTHPCGSIYWRVMRTGADVRIACGGCGHQVMLPRVKFEKGMKRVVPPEEAQERLLAAGTAARAAGPATGESTGGKTGGALVRAGAATGAKAGAGARTGSAAKHARTGGEGAAGRNAAAAGDAAGGSKATGRQGERTGANASGRAAETVPAVPRKRIVLTDEGLQKK